jgi:hypothetical protein
MGKARMTVGVLMAAAAITFSSAKPLALAATPAPVTAVATQAAPTTAFSNARVMAVQALTPSAMDETVGGGFWDWAKDFVEGVKDGIITATILIIIIAVA